MITPLSLLQASVFSLPRLFYLSFALHLQHTQPRVMSYNYSLRSCPTTGSRYASPSTCCQWWNISTTSSPSGTLIRSSMFSIPVQLNRNRAYGRYHSGQRLWLHEILGFFDYCCILRRLDWLALSILTLQASSGVPLMLRAHTPDS